MKLHSEEVYHVRDRERETVNPEHLWRYILVKWLDFKEKFLGHLDKKKKNLGNCKTISDNIIRHFNRNALCQMKNGEMYLMSQGKEIWTKDFIFIKTDIWL